jgi:hypothetical protein
MAVYIEHFLFGLLFAGTGWAMQYVCTQRGWHGFIHRSSVAVAIVALETVAVVTLVG